MKQHAPSGYIRMMKFRRLTRLLTIRRYAAIVAIVCCHGYAVVVLRCQGNAVVDIGFLVVVVIEEGFVDVITLHKVAIRIS